MLSPGDVDWDWVVRFLVDRQCQVEGEYMLNRDFGRPSVGLVCADEPTDEPTWGTTFASEDPSFDTVEVLKRLGFGAVFRLEERSTDLERWLLSPWLSARFFPFSRPVGAVYLLGPGMSRGLLSRVASVVLIRIRGADLVALGLSGSPWCEAAAYGFASRT